MRGALLAVVVTGLAAGEAAAQPQAPVQNRPSFSPYLNLLRGANNGGASPALNYYGLVRPELQLRQQNATLQQQVNQNSQGIQGINDAATQGADPLLPFTGRGATFMNYSHYFPALGAGSSRIGNRGVGGSNIGMSSINQAGNQIGRGPSSNIGGAGRAGGAAGGRR